VYDRKRTVLGTLLDIITDLLGGETEGTELGGKRGHGGGLATDSAEHDDGNGRGIKLGGHDSKKSTEGRTTKKKKSYGEKGV
jgi:hypothetical protein